MIDFFRIIVYNRLIRNKEQHKKKREVNKMMYYIFVGMCVAIMVALISMMGIIFFNEKFGWFENAYEKLYKMFEKVLTR